MQLKLTIEKERIFEEQKLTRGEDGVTVTLAPGESKWYLFDTDESVHYRFYSTDTTDPLQKMYLFDSLLPKNNSKAADSQNGRGTLTCIAELVQNQTISLFFNRLLHLE